MAGKEAKQIGPSQTYTHILTAWRGSF